MIRLLNTPIIGRLTAAVASSCNDMLAGLSKWDILSTPPGFCAWAAPLAHIVASAARKHGAAIVGIRENRFIGVHLPLGSGRIAVLPVAKVCYSSSQISSKLQPLNT